MIEGAIIGLIVAIIMIFVKKSQEKKAISKVLNDDVIDQPDFVAFFHFASEATFLKKGFKFFDSNGVLALHGHNLTYRPNQKGKTVINVDIKSAQLRLAPEKRKMKWLEINDNGNKYYLTTFGPGAFTIDKSKMDEFLKILNL